MDKGKKVILSITGNQTNEFGEDNKIELITEGLLYKKGDDFCIEYEESDLSGLEGTRTTIRVEDKRIYLERTGAHESRYVFEKGKKYINYSETPIGNIEMGIYPTVINSDMQDDSGSLGIKYQLDFSD